MNREIDEKILTSKHNILLEFPTGFGKSKCALDIVTHNNYKKVLIVIPRLVLKENWKAEIKKWGGSTASYVTYISLYKHAGIEYDCIIFDECHHLSDRCLDIIDTLKYKQAILLSATVSRNKWCDFQTVFRPIERHKISLQQAVADEVLPSPQIILLPLKLDTQNQTCTFTKGKGKEKIECNFVDRWKYFKNPKYTVTVKCTPAQYHLEMSNMIEWYKRASFSKPVMKNLWLNKAGQRLRWLSQIKEEQVMHLINSLKNQRFMIFCSSIEQTELFGNAVNSNQKEQTALKQFNEGKINYISACNMLDEGINITACKYGIFAGLNSSDRMIIQKGGRILRHHEPVLIIPYFEGTRDEEIKNKMIVNYNPRLIKTINNLNELKL